MLIQSTHADSDRDEDAYFTPIEATLSLIALEREHIPPFILEPACGNGAIVEPLKNAGYTVAYSDIIDYGYKYTIVRDYLTYDIEWQSLLGIITNPPYKLALEFLKKALTEAAYVAFLLRTNFLESTSRLEFFRKNPPARVWISSRRLPMMHRQGWIGPQAPSNTCHAWFIWDKNSPQKQHLDWFDWKEHTTGETYENLEELSAIGRRN